MKKIIRLNIEIDIRNFSNISGTIKVSNLLFTDYDNLVDYDIVLRDLKKAFKMAGEWDMLTFDIEVNNEHCNNRVCIRSVRYTNRYGELKRAAIEGAEPSFRHWSDANQKSIFADLKWMVDQTNQTFVKECKNIASNSRLLTY